MKNIFILLVLFSILISCGNIITDSKSLPILGRHEYITNKQTGKTDTVLHKIATFDFINQEGEHVSNATFKNKIYVADFFFTSCPTICPVMKTQMLRIHDQYQNNPFVSLLSHTIDPTYDTLEILKDYADRLGVNGEKWHFVTGEKSKIYNIAQTSYYTTANEDKEAEGGFIHSGAFILVDMNGHIRGTYDGTKAESVDKLLADIQVLLAEYS